MNDENECDHKISAGVKEPADCIMIAEAEVVRQGVPDHGAMHNECSASNSG